MNFTITVSSNLNPPKRAPIPNDYRSYSVEGLVRNKLFNAGKTFFLRRPPSGTPKNTLEIYSQVPWVLFNAGETVTELFLRCSICYYGA